MSFSFSFGHNSITQYYYIINYQFTLWRSILLGLLQVWIGNTSKLLRDIEYYQFQFPTALHIGESLIPFFFLWFFCPMNLASCTSISILSFLVTKYTIFLDTPRGSGSYDNLLLLLLLLTNVTFNYALYGLVLSSNVILIKLVYILFFLLVFCFSPIFSLSFKFVIWCIELCITWLNLTTTYFSLSLFSYFIFLLVCCNTHVLIQKKKKEDTKQEIPRGFLAQIRNMCLWKCV